MTGSTVQRTCGAVAPIIAILVFLGANAHTAHAAPLLNNTTIPAAAESDPIGGSVIANTGPVAFSSGTLSGTLTSQVIQGATNPLGGLTFTYLLSLNSGSADGVERLTVSPYDAFLTDASYNTSTGGFAPTTISRSANGNVVGFNFTAPNTLSPGATSYQLVVQTNAPLHAVATASVINGTTATVTSFVPVPEPASLSLFALGAGTVLLRRSRR